MIKIVVPISGGKDSQTCLHLALEECPKEEVRGLFCDTQNEHPLTYAHIEKLKELVQIDTVCAGSVEDKVRKYKRWPGGGARHCTEELKIVPGKKYYNSLAEQQGCGFEVWFGMRLSESHERRKRYCDKEGLIAPHIFMPGKYPQYLGKKGVMFRLPIMNWSSQQVLEYLNGRENPLYGQGFDRVGCFPCFAGGKAWKEKAFNHDDFGRSQFKKYSIIATDIGVDFMNPPKKKKESDPCKICQI